MFYKPVGDVLLYTVHINNKPRLYSYDTENMTQILLEENIGATNGNCISNNYLYTWNIEVREENGEKVPYVNTKRVDLLTGNITFLGEPRREKPEYQLIGAYNGLILATDPEETVTYVASEDDPMNFKQIWNRRMAFIFTNGKDLFFKSKDNEDASSDTYYFYHTDSDGNVLSKHEMNGGMYWGTLSEGRYLYYIPQEMTTVKLPCGEIKMPMRNLYKLDTETGETTVAFEFVGDYSYLWISLGNSDIMVKDNKLYTNNLEGYIYPNGDLTAECIEVTYKSGLVIIDLATGDLDYVTGDYAAKNDYSLTWNKEHIDMNMDY